MKRVILWLMVCLPPLGLGDTQKEVLPRATGPPRLAFSEAVPDPSFVAEKVRQYYRDTPLLEGKVELRRYWRDRWSSNFSSRVYTAAVKMSAAGVSGSVYEGYSVVATYHTLIGEEPRVDMRDDEVDGCLFGTLQSTWLGSDGQLPPFVDWIVNGEFEGVVEVSGYSCFSFSNRSANETDGEYFSVCHRVFVDQESYRVIVWETDQFSSPTGAPIMTCRRQYSCW